MTADVSERHPFLGLAFRVVQVELTWRFCRSRKPCQRLIFRRRQPPTEVDAHCLFPWPQPRTQHEVPAELEAEVMYQVQIRVQTPAPADPKDISFG